VQFSLPGEDTWSEGKLLLENGSLCFRRSNEQPRRSFLPFLKKGEETGFFVPIRSIRDVIREESGILTIKHIGNATLPAQEPGSGSLLSTQLSADEQILNEVERELVMSMDAYTFNVYFTHAGEGGVLSMEKNIELEKGLLKISNSALWIIGRENHKRITWDDIVNVEQKKRSRYKGSEYGAVSIDYFGGGSSNAVQSTIVITKGNTIEVLKRHVMELLNEYIMEEKLPDMENQILSMMYAGAMDLSSPASTAEAFGLSEDELKNHLEHLNELGIVDATNQTMTKKGIKYVMDLSKNGTFGG
jgi:helix-turn-helix protein